MKKFFSFILYGAVSVLFASCEDATRDGGGEGSLINSSVQIGPKEAVDLGLSSGILWATCNVGATSPEDYGAYFAFGETKPKENYDWSKDGEYKWGIYKPSISPDYGMTNYNNTDGKTTLESSDDAATANWGSDWRMPTYAEIQELESQCECVWTWKEYNGVNGYEVKGKNGNSIFLPAAGYVCGTKFYDVGSHGRYWSSDINDTRAALHLSFDADIPYSGSALRCYGLPIRPVYSPKR